jgi:hypothetical protein
LLSLDCGFDHFLGQLLKLGERFLGADRAGFA